MRSVVAARRRLVPHPTSSARPDNMKRSRSGARPPPGGAKQLAKHHARYTYALCVFTPDGTLADPTSELFALVAGNDHPETWVRNSRSSDHRQPQPAKVLRSIRG